jgi:nitroreductase
LTQVKAGAGAVCHVLPAGKGAAAAVGRCRAHARVPPGEITSAEDDMDIYHRRAVREFTRELVDHEKVRFVIAAAVQAPSAMNRQPWSFVVVEDQAALDRYSRAAKAHLLETLREDSPLGQYRALLAEPSFHLFYHAPALIVICATSAEEGTAEDCCLAAENLMLAAHGADLGTCWIGFARSWLDLAVGRKELGIPSHYIPVAPIAIGHPKVSMPPVSRQHPDIRWLAP